MSGFNKSDVAETTEMNNTPTIAVDGGLEVRELNDVRNSDTLVRSYSTPPGDQLYAYESEAGKHHIVVSRGSEPGDRWEKRVPATIERPVPGQKLWTIPENWEQRVVSKRDTIAYGLFYVPESDVWARVSIPTNDWLIDAWYQVKSVGDLAVEGVGELGSSYDVRQLAHGYDEEYDEDSVVEGAEAVREIANNWDIVKEELRLSTEWVRYDGMDEMQPGDQPIHADRNWQIEFHQSSIFRPGEAIKRAVNLSEYDIRLSTILSDLRNADHLPSSHKFKLTLDDSSIDMRYYLRGLVEAGASPAEAVDYYMVEVEDMTQTTWARERGVDQSTVSGNVNQAKENLD